MRKYEKVGEKDGRADILNSASCREWSHCGRRGCRESCHVVNHVMCNK